MDPLSDVLSLLKLRSYVSGGFDVGGKWSIQFPQHEGIKCYAVVSGQCWLLGGGGSRRGALEDGGLLPAAARAAFPPGKRSDFDARRCPHAFSGQARMAASSSYNGGGDYFGVGGHFALTRPACRHPVGDAAADRAYPERIGQGGAAMVAGADDAGVARAAAGRLSGRAAPRRT